MTATATETTAERLENKRAALLNRQQELRDVLEAAPADIAIARETWHRSESAADEKRLKQAQRLQSAAASELAEIEADLYAIDRLLAQELAKAQAVERERLAARLGELVGAETDAFKVAADRFVELYEAWLAFSATQKALQSQWWVSPGREGVQPGHLLDPTPADFAAFISILYRSALNRHGVGFQQLEHINHLVPDLGSDTALELGGNGVQAIRGF
jgi:hypothetical protein